MTDEPVVQDPNGGWGDRPIRHRSDDRLGRARFAAALAADVRAAPEGGGLVVGLTGAWGTGKTSVLNMLAEELDGRAYVINFNPWLFSGTEGLLTAYFHELAAQLGHTGKLKNLAGTLSDYGDAIGPLAAVIGLGVPVKIGTRLLKRAGRGPSVEQQRLSLESELASLDRPVVVLLDDIDRLRPEEVKDIVRLVRLVGDFPNTVYVLAFDRHRIEECLGDGDPDRGRAYLEKIVQVTQDLPDVSERDVAALVVEGLQTLVGRYPTSELDGAAWQDIFAFLIGPLLETPRHARRYLNALPLTLSLIGDEVALEDILALEALRVLRPRVFAALTEVAKELTSVGGMGSYSPGSSRDNSPLAPLIEADAELAPTICRLLFPAARRHLENMHYGPEWLRTWRRKRKVAHPVVLQTYLQRRLPDGTVPAAVIDALFENIGDTQALGGGLLQISDDDLVGALDRLLDYASDVQSADVAAALPALLDTLPRLPAGRSGPLTEDADMKLMRLTFRLLERIEDDDDRATAVKAAISRTTSLSGQLLLLNVAGHRSGVGQKLIPEGEASAIETDLRNEAVGRSASTLANEPHLERIMAVMAETPQGKAAVQRLVEDDALFVQLLRTASSVAHSWAMGSVAVQSEQRLMWEPLEDLVGADLLGRRVRDLVAGGGDGPSELPPSDLALLELAARYVAGWRPDARFRTGEPIAEDSTQAD